MILQQDNKILSSLLMFVDHTVLKEGAAFTNYSGRLYPISGGRFSGMNSYTTPYKQLVSDISIPNAQIMSGVYVNGTYIKPGQSGLGFINISEGQAFTTGTYSNVSGYYAVKDINVYLTSRPEEELLFETKLQMRPKIPQTLTGLPQNTETYPCVYLRIERGENTPLCLGNVDNNEMEIRALVLTDSLSLTDAVCNILKNTARRRFKTLEPSGLPFNAYGGYTGVNFNYDALTSGVVEESIIWRVRHSNLAKTQELNKLNPAVFPAMVDFTVWSIRG
jgi:hypothetical protein